MSVKLDEFMFQSLITLCYLHNIYTKDLEPFLPNGLILAHSVFSSVGRNFEQATAMSLFLQGYFLPEAGGYHV